MPIFVRSHIKWKTRLNIRDRNSNQQREIKMYKLNKTCSRENTRIHDCV